MLIRNTLQFMTVTLLASGLAAQTGSVRGPIAGMVYDGAAHAIRPLVGLPGASYLGNPMVSELDFASVAPDSRAALAVTRGRLYLLTSLETGNPQWILLERSGQADRVAWSEDSTAAAVYAEATGRVRIWSNLAPGSRDLRGARPSPRLSSRQIRPGTEGMPRISDLGDVSVLGGKVSAMAFGAPGEVMVGIERDQAGGVYRLTADSQPALLARASAPSGIAFANGGQDLFVADRTRQEVFQIRNYRDRAGVTLFAGRDRGIEQPVAVAVSCDGRTLIVASASGRKLALFDIETRALAGQLELDFEPSRLERLGDASLFLLNSRLAGSETLQVFAGGEKPAVYFVPAASVAAVSDGKPVED